MPWSGPVAKAEDGSGGNPCLPKTGLSAFTKTVPGTNRRKPHFGARAAQATAAAATSDSPPATPHAAG